MCRPSGAMSPAPAEGIGSGCASPPSMEIRKRRVSDSTPFERRAERNMTDLLSGVQPMTWQS